MLLEVGLRVEAAQDVWRRLHQLQRSAAWVAARDNASQCLGTATCSPHQVRMLRLGDRGNDCYSNATLKCIMYASTFRGGLGPAFNGGLLRFLQRIVQQTGTTHLWSQPIWLAMMTGWREPSRQHGGAEFLQFLLAGQPHTADALTINWQARAARWHVRDCGRGKFCTNLDTAA